LVTHRGLTERVFLNRRHQPITRYGIHTMVERHTLKASAQTPSPKTKRVSPHAETRHGNAPFASRRGY
jgi:hypothetical protein